jgi:hypothetical protein
MKIDKCSRLAKWKEIRVLRIDAEELKEEG